eukprot:11510540-Alexandrium_andersonii.AAC.1
MSASLVGSEMCIRDRPFLRAWFPLRLSGVAPARAASAIAEEPFLAQAIACPGPLPPPSAFLAP